MLNCPLKYPECIKCPEYSKEGLCDYPYKNTPAEIKHIELYGHRVDMNREFNKRVGVN